MHVSATLGFADGVEKLRRHSLLSELFQPSPPHSNELFATIFGSVHAGPAHHAAASARLRARADSVLPLLVLRSTPKKLSQRNGAARERTGNSTEAFRRTSSEDSAGMQSRGLRSSMASLLSLRRASTAGTTDSAGTPFRGLRGSRMSFLSFRRASTAGATARLHSGRRTPSGGGHARGLSTAAMSSFSASTASLAGSRPFSRPSSAA